MKTIVTALTFASMSLAAATVAAQAQDPAKKPMDGKTPTAQECKDHMAKKDATKKDDASMKMDQACAEVMKKDAGTPMKK